MSTQLFTDVQTIGPEHAGVLMTPEEFDTHEEWNDLYRYELLQGRLIVTPPPLESERDPNEELGYLLRYYREQDPQGHVLDKTLPEQTVPTLENRRRADRALWIGLGHTPDPRVDLPTIVIEFVSGAHRDRVRDYLEKRQEYLAAGIQEYWIIDRFHRQMTAIRNRPGTPVEEIIREGGTYQTPLLPGFILPLDRLLGVADDWA